MLITEEYRALNADLHGRTEFGVTAPRYMNQIAQIAEGVKAKTILDYGSGPRKHVHAALGRTYKVQSYDPAIPDLADDPVPADLMVACDVLEHIEPELLSAVLDHMAENTLRAAFLSIATRPAKKTLADGRNAHLIVKPPQWWLPLLWQRWRLTQFADLGGEMVAVMETK